MSVEPGTGPELPLTSPTPQNSLNYKNYAKKNYKTKKTLKYHECNTKRQLGDRSGEHIRSTEKARNKNHFNHPTAISGFVVSWVSCFYGFRGFIGFMVS